jgi:hypothetical protein
LVFLRYVRGVDGRLSRFESAVERAVVHFSICTRCKISMRLTKEIGSKFGDGALKNPQRRVQRLEHVQ